MKHFIQKSIAPQAPESVIKFWQSYLLLSILSISGSLIPLIMYAATGHYYPNDLMPSHLNTPQLTPLSAIPGLICSIALLSGGAWAFYRRQNWARLTLCLFLFMGIFFNILSYILPANMQFINIYAAPLIHHILAWSGVVIQVVLLYYASSASLHQWFTKKGSAQAPHNTSIS